MFDPSVWAWPQWAMFILMILGLLIAAGSHGQPRENYNGFLAFISFGLSMFLLVSGGFFA